MYMYMYMYICICIYTYTHVYGYMLFTHIYTCPVINVINYSNVRYQPHIKTSPLICFASQLD